MMQEKMWKLIIQNDFVLNNAFFYIKCTYENKDANVIINKLKSWIIMHSIACYFDWKLIYSIIKGP